MPRRRRLSKFESFTCPNCTALYHMVKVEAGAKTTDRDTACNVAVLNLLVEKDN
jgi:hypothetical protein